MAARPLSFLATLVSTLIFITALFTAPGLCTYRPPPSTREARPSLRLTSHNASRVAGAGDDNALQAARVLLEKGQRAMAVANEHILNSPSPNLYEVLDAAELNKVRVPAPFLDLEEGTASARRRRALANSTVDGSRAYRVPAELVEAARLIAEAEPFEADDGSELRAKHQAVKARRPFTQDTHAMSPILKRPNGLQIEVVNDPPELFRFGSNSTATASTASSGASLGKRSETDWWMAEIQQRGQSPYAPSGYKVWRNVKDYGAKGDGKTDDTAAINRAISDGGRCGDGCGGSTIYPATVYFPTGDYLVSSSIIQYYNTELLGNPITVPRILAHPSFVGLGVITTNVFREDGTQWYLNSNNVLRSIKNMIIDIRKAPSNAYVCGIHWQVAQGTSLENINFWSEWTAETTQQGIYSENGRGGVLTDLFFNGGAFGAYMGSQQFTANGLYFENVDKAALQIHWDHGWTLNDVEWKNVKTGIKMTGGRGGNLGSDQAVGSLMVTDVTGQNMNDAIISTLVSEKATSFLIQNAVFDAVETIVVDEHDGKILLNGDGGNSAVTVVDSWGFGRVTGPFGNDDEFVNGGDVYAPIRHASLTVRPDKAQMPQQTYFTRRRPGYSDLGFSQLMDVKALGAKGDGKTDDTAVLNHILSAAANMSAVVFIPHGIYLVKNTLDVPVGSRLIGQAWSQIMGTGPNFENMTDPRPVVRVGRPGNRGVVEMQSLLFTVRGPTAGAVLMEWNVHQTFQGSAGLWDCHFRVGGAEGSELQADKCPKKQPGTVNKGCVGASLMLHITSSASAYLENVWVWTADHDIDDPGHGQTDIYTGRGVLVESRGPTWLWGVSAEHSTLYQIQLSRAQNVLLGLVQTETPYFQPDPTSIEPFAGQLGAFPGDPRFDDCDKDAGDNCVAAWGARIADSSSVYVLSANLYVWFQAHDSACIDSGRHDCQQKTFFVEQSSDVWIFNLVTIGAVEMMSPLGWSATLASANRAPNYVTASIMAWLGGANHTAGPRDFEGYYIHSPQEVSRLGVSSICAVALTMPVQCDAHTESFRGPAYHGALNNQTLANSICAPSCEASIDDWVFLVDMLCGDITWDNGARVSYMGGYIRNGIKEQCHCEVSSNRFCNDIIDGFTEIQDITEMPQDELCSECYLGRLQMMQASPYSVYGFVTFYQDALKRAVDVCGLGYGQPTSPQPPVIPPASAPDIWCQSEKTYTTVDGDTCDGIAESFGVSSASIFYGNPAILSCSAVVPGVEICLPLQCRTHVVQPTEDCVSIHANTGVAMLDIMINNPWITYDCGNLHTANYTLGNVICLSIPGGAFDGSSDKDNADPSYNQYTTERVEPPAGAPVADKTTLRCGRWHVATAQDTCATITGRWITANLFRQVNPSLGGEGPCSAGIRVGSAYCTGPNRGWNVPAFEGYDEVNYLGCFAPIADGGKVLRGEWVSDDKRMTFKACTSYCTSLGFAYFGIHNGDTCYCDNQLGMDVVAAGADECRAAACTGDGDGDGDGDADADDRPCGGPRGVSVYSFHDVLYKKYAQVGCFPDSVFGGGAAKAVDDDMERQQCAQLCLDEHAYFGLARGNECHCGDGIGATSEAAPGACDTVCSGEALELCGGDSFVTVYSSLSEARG